MSPHRLKFKITGLMNKLYFILPILLILVWFIWQLNVIGFDFHHHPNTLLLQKPNNETNLTDDEQEAQQGFCDFPKFDPWDKSILEFIRRERDPLQCIPNSTLEGMLIHIFIPNGHHLNFNRFDQVRFVVQQLFY